MTQAKYQELQAFIILYMPEINSIQRKMLLDKIDEVVG